MNNKIASSDVFLSSLKVQRQQVLQSGDQVGTEEMSDGKQLSPPPETLNPVQSHSLCVFNQGRSSLHNITRNQPILRKTWLSLPSKTTSEIRNFYVE